MASGVKAEVRRQRLGRRLGRTPYYTVAEHSERRLLLISRAEANRGPGRRILIGGLVMLALAALFVGGGVYAAGTDVGFGAVIVGALLGGLLGAYGGQRALGGYAVLTTYNRIEANTDAGAVVFSQGNKVAPERNQRIPIAELQALRLRRRPLDRRGSNVVVLELVARDGGDWIVDSATDVEALRPAAEGLSTVLRMDLAQA